ncbi:MAG: mannitol dehydrogenase family protein [Geminicoccaceae bacterium]|nr:mannitol dehydrogenase family protein [Geminicoccaceae bacterium]
METIPVQRAEATRIMHLGPGAFFRAHMADYSQKALAEDPSMGIAAVSMRSTAVVDALRERDCIYSLSELHADGLRTRPIGVIREAVALARDRERVMRLAVDPGLSIISMTVTEKGYSLDPATGALDLDQSDIRHDLANRDNPVTVAGLLTAILSARRHAGLDWPTVMSLDNLRGNGQLLKSAIIRFARKIDGELADAIERDLACPSSMVDRITPATTDADRQAIARQLGWMDHAAVVTEPFSQWVIEDRFDGARPAWDRHGALITGDVEPFENAKLRLVNAPHSSLAWLGLLRGHETVADSMADNTIRTFIEALLKEEMIPATAVPAGLDPHAHVDSVIERFANPAIRHRVAQIAMDSSQKIAQRLVPALEWHLREGRVPRLLCRAVAAWIAVWQRGLASPDPMTAELASRISARPQETARAFLGMRSIFGERIGADAAVQAAVCAEITRI